MPLYAYRARNGEGALVRGKLEAENHEAIEQELSNSGLIPISINEAKASPLSFDIARYKAIFERVLAERGAITQK